jgi:hypothetical protein
MLASPEIVKRGIEHARHLYVQRVAGYTPPAEPFLDPEGLEWFRQRLPSVELFLEYGSGGSTLLANKLAVASVSVESDPYYADVVRESLPNPELATIVTPPMGLTVEWGMPLVGRRRKGVRYVNAPFEYLQSSPDLVLVDGRYRAACALETARRLNLSGTTATLFLDDYRDRPYYRVIEEYLGEPPMVGRAAVFEIGSCPVPEKVIRRLAEDAR